MGVARDFCTKLTSFANFLAQGKGCLFANDFSLDCEIKIEGILMAIVELFFAWQNLVRRFSKYWLVCSGLEEFICGAYYFSFLFKFYLFLFNFSSVILISAPKRDEESEESGNLMRYMEKEWLTTASLSRGWVPETHRSFHYWQQPAPRWRLLPWLSNPGNPVKSLWHPSHWINSGKREGRGGENCWDDKLILFTTLQLHTQSTRNNTSNKQHMKFWHVHICKKPLTITEHWCSLLLTLLNCIYFVSLFCLNSFCHSNSFIIAPECVFQ